MERKNLKRPRVAVIGGGMTGLALAYYLGRSDCRVTLIEKGHALSGLLAFTHIETVPIEHYYHHFFTTDRYQLELMHELGLDDRILWGQSASAIYAGGKVIPFVTKLDYLRLPIIDWPTKIRGAVAALRMRGQHPEDLPAELTAENYLRQQFGSRGWEKLWKPLLVNKFGADAHRLPAQWIAKRIQIRASSSRSGREVLGYLHGSYRVLADALATAIQKQGCDIWLNSEVRELQPNPDGAVRINDRDFDVVVSTIAPQLLKRIVPMLEIPDVKYRAAICPLFTLRKSITPYYWINILDTAVPFSVIVNQQAWLPPNYYLGRWPVYVGHYVAQDSELLKRGDDELRAYYLGYLEKIFPGFCREVVDCQIGRAKFAQPVMTAPWTPLSHVTNLPNLYVTSMAHIYPEDRGVNYSFREAKRIAQLLTREMV